MDRQTDDTEMSQHIPSSSLVSDLQIIIYYQEPTF